MKPSISSLFLFLSLFAVRVAAAEPALVVDLWPGKPAGDNAESIGPEKFRNPLEGSNAKKWLTNVTRPQPAFFRPAKDKDTGVAVLICPGGGCHNLAWELEGEEVADWLNSLGITGIILKYRCPRRPGDPLGVPAPGPLKGLEMVA